MTEKDNEAKPETQDIDQKGIINQPENETKLLRIKTGYGQHASVTLNSNLFSRQIGFLH